MLKSWESIDFAAVASNIVGIEDATSNVPSPQDTSSPKSRGSEDGITPEGLGCLCEALLASGIEPCCVTSYLALQHPEASQNLSDFQEMGSAQNSLASHDKTASTEVRSNDVNSMEKCCGKSSFGVSHRPSHEMNNKEIFGHPQKSCCTSGPSTATINASPNATAPQAGCEYKKHCTSTSFAKLKAVISKIKIDGCSRQACCTSAMLKPVNTGKCSRIGCHNIKASTKAPEGDTKSCSERDCCSSSISVLISGAQPSEEDHCSLEVCCSRNGPTASYAVDGQVAATGQTTAMAIPHKDASFSDLNTMDAEKGSLQMEHLVISVQGMTCVGCEKMLCRSLESLPAISNIKTSLVLAQAEFDLIASNSVDGGNITKVIERMTGFTCKKITQSGHHLDLVVDDDIQSYFHGTDLPAGVTDLTATNKTTVRVTYQPEVVGARDLLLDPFFRKARLGPVVQSPMVTSGRYHVRKMFLMAFLSALLTIPVLVLAWAPIPKHDILYGAISLALATTVQTVIAAPFYVNAFKTLFFSGMIDMDLLIVLSTSTAFIYSIIAYAYLAAGKPLLTGQFFETSTLLVTLIMAGRCVSAYARQKAVESISIESLQTPTALLFDPKSHLEQEIDARLLQYKDIFKVLPDTSIATDGIVIAGETEVDESMITGEATLIAKKPGMPVVAGSLNHSGVTIIQVTRLLHENTIKTIGNLVDEAKSTKPKIQEIADRVASIFVPVILLIAVLVFVSWIAVGILREHKSGMTASIVAMTYAISALIISCPCAIGLAVPMVVAIAGGVAAKHGLIFKSAETIEIARYVSHVVFDKTGTLTQGKLSVAVDIYPTDQFDLIAPLILGLTTNSKHPVSVSIATYIAAQNVQLSPVNNVVSIPGSGIEAMWNGRKIRAGNPHWLGIAGAPAVEQVLSQGLTMFCVTMDDDVVAVFGLKDTLRYDAIELIDDLKRRSVNISIVSGDNDETVHSISTLVGVPRSHVRSRCSPADKQMYVKHLLEHEKGVVMFCGDGTNDAAALAQASIGIHMNEGTDIAQSAADVILMHPSLKGILILIDLSKAFYRRVVFNFLWSFIYNVFAILLAAGAFPNARIAPQFAGLGEIASVLPVIAIALQLRYFRFQGIKKD